MDRIENGMYTTNGSSTEEHKSFSVHYGLQRENDCSVFSNIYFALKIMESTYVNQVYKNMVPLKNDVKSTNVLCTGSHKSFPILWGNTFKVLRCIISYGGNFLKRLYCSKYNEINVGHSDTQKHFC